LTSLRRKTKVSDGTSNGSAVEFGRAEPELRSVPVSAITTNARNPRRKLTGIDELAGSIRTHGLLQPVVVRVVGDMYQLVAGHRRLAAARDLGWERVPAMVRDEGEDDAYVLTLVENLQRVDLSARDQATALEVLVRERGWTTRQVASAISRSQAFVSKRLRVFEDAMLAPAVMAGRLSVSAAEELLAVPERHRYELLAVALEMGWEYNEIRQAAKQQRLDSNRSRGPRQPGLTRRVRELRMELRNVDLHDLMATDLRELRLFFAELSMLARTKQEDGRKRVFPLLPSQETGRGHAKANRRQRRGHGSANAQRA
jgi:ParB family chromosome partitioning protein